LWHCAVHPVLVLRFAEAQHDEQLLTLLWLQGEVKVCRGAVRRTRDGREIHRQAPVDTIGGTGSV
jgi:hypothetical protein